MPESKKIALALSGGGFRATLFHLGVLKYLQTKDQLKNITHITAVSGGAVIAGHLSRFWESYCADFDQTALKLIEFTQSDVRGGIGRRLPLFFVKGFSATSQLELAYERLLVSDPMVDKLADAPPKPAIYLMGTNATRAHRTCMYGFGDGHVVFQDGERLLKFDTATLKLQRKIAISSAFPAFFPPVVLEADKDIGPVRPEIRDLFGKRNAFTDGGVYDNFGIRMMETIWRNPGEFGERPDQVLISDAGLEFDEIEPTSNVLKNVFRAVDITMNRLADLDLERLGSLKDVFDFEHICIRDKSASEIAIAKELQSNAAKVRTDLDCFSDLEVQCLVRHGFALAKDHYPLPNVDKQERDRLPPTSTDDEQIKAESCPLDKLLERYSKSPPVSLTESQEDDDYVDELNRQKNALRKSSKRQLRLFSFSDLASYVSILALACCIAGCYLIFRPSQELGDDWNEMRKRGVLRVGISSGEKQGAFIYIRADNTKPDGFEIKLTNAIASHLQERFDHELDVKFIRKPWTDVLAMPSRGEADMIISTISYLPGREERYGLKFSAPYFVSEGQAIYSRLAAPVNRITDKDVIAVKRGTTSEELAVAYKEMYGCGIIPVDELTDALTEVEQESASCALGDETYSHTIDLSSRSLQHAVIQSNHYPESFPPFRIREQYVIGVPKGNKSLLSVINEKILELAMTINGETTELDRMYQESRKPFQSPAKEFEN